MNIKVSVVLGMVALFAIAFSAYSLQAPKKPPAMTFNERWGHAMEDIYRSQDELRASGHIKHDTMICTKKWCDPHPKGDR